MKRGIFLISLSTMLLLGMAYAWWAMQQPRVGPVGSGTVPASAYIPIIGAMFSATVGLFTGIMLIVKRKAWSRYQDEYLTRDQLKARYIPMLVISGLLSVLTIVLIAWISVTAKSHEVNLTGPLLGLFGFGAMFIITVVRYIYVLDSRKDESR